MLTAFILHQHMCIMSFYNLFQVPNLILTDDFVKQLKRIGIEAINVK